MSSVMVMVLVIFPLFIPAVRPSEDLWDLKCQPAVGIYRQTTVINCSFKGVKDIEIVAVTLTRVAQDKPFLEIHLYNGKQLGDPRFSLESPVMGPSLRISETMFSDEGKYMYRVITDRGEQTVQISINITAKYQNPITSTWPQYVPKSGPVDLYCNATDGYPAGFIHWFDRSGTNWTMNSHLTKATKDTDSLKSVDLSSKLTFKSIDLSLAPFRCIVLNSKYVLEGESTLITSSMRDSNEESSPSNTTNIVAGVMVIGSLIVGLLFALLFFRKRHFRSYESGKTDEDDLEKGNITP